jgi:hypothetical protein
VVHSTFATSLLLDDLDLSSLYRGRNTLVYNLQNDASEMLRNDIYVLKSSGEEFGLIRVPADR